MYNALYIKINPKDFLRSFKEVSRVMRFLLKLRNLQNYRGGNPDIDI